MAGKFQIADNRQRIAEQVIKELQTGKGQSLLKIWKQHFDGKDEASGVPASRTIERFFRRAADEIRTRTVRIEKASPPPSKRELEGLHKNEKAMAEKFVVVEASSETTLDRRGRRGQPEKEAIGAALWNFLFHQRVGSLSTVTGRAFESTIHYRSDLPHADAKDDIEQKRLRLVRRSSMYICVDAGSSCLTACSELTAFPAPVCVEFDQEKASDGQNVRLISLGVLTNSIPAANLLASPEFNLDISITGGTERRDRRSLVGAADWVRAGQAAGLISSMDLAIVGLTGISNSPLIPSAMCDDPRERQLKSAFLGLAEGGMRCLVFHSSKIDFSEGECEFTAINGECVDLVVMDDGYRLEKSEARTPSLALEMRKKFQKLGVHVLTVSLSEPAESKRNFDI